MYCSNCGTQNPDDSSFCSKCGNKLALQTTAPQQSVSQQTQTAVAPARKTNGMALAALITGIAGIFIPLSAIVAIILGAVSLNQIKKDPALEGKGMALAGLIIGSIVLVLWILFVILIVVLAAVSSNTSSGFWVSALSIPALI